MSEIKPEVLAEIRNIQMLIGRNVLVFQNVERILKFIHNFRNGSGTFEILLKRKVKIDELSLGRLTDESVLKRIDSKLNKQSDTELHFAYDILSDYEALDFAIKFFNDINDDRNLLIHNFTSIWPMDKSENREKAKNWLLDQYKAIFAQREVLVSSLKLIVERTNIVGEYFSSNEGLEDWLEFLASDEEA